MQRGQGHVAACLATRQWHAWQKAACVHAMSLMYRAARPAAVQPRPRQRGLRQSQRSPPPILLHHAHLHERQALHLILYDGQPAALLQRHPLRRQQRMVILRLTPMRRHGMRCCAPSRRSWHACSMLHGGQWLRGGVRGGGSGELRRAPVRVEVEHVVVAPQQLLLVCPAPAPACKHRQRRCRHGPESAPLSAQPPARAPTTGVALLHAACCTLHGPVEQKKHAGGEAGSQAWKHA